MKVPEFAIQCQQCGQLFTKFEVRFAKEMIMGMTPSGFIVCYKCIVDLKKREEILPLPYDVLKENPAVDAAIRSGKS